MAKTACMVCLDLLLKLAQKGERNFRQAEIERLVHHRPCSTCQPKSRTAFLCELCTEFGQRAKTPMLVTYGRVRVDENHHRQERRKAVREPHKMARMREQIAKLLGTQSVYVAGQRGMRETRRELSSAEIAEKVGGGCTLAFVDNVRAQLANDERLIEQRARDEAKAAEEQPRLRRALDSQRRADKEYRTQLRKNARGILRGA